MSHPFIECLIGGEQRELLDQMFVWTTNALENRLQYYQRYYNEYWYRPVGLELLQSILASTTSLISGPPDGTTIVAGDFNYRKQPEF
jgi:hypothetical protein